MPIYKKVCYIHLFIFFHIITISILLASSLEGLIQHDNAIELKRRLENVSDITLLTDTGSSIDRKRQIYMPLLCRIVKERKEKLLIASLTYYKENREQLIQNEDPINTSNKGHSLGNYTPLQWAFYHQPPQYERWNKGIELILNYGLDISSVFEEMVRLDIVAAPDESLNELIALLGAYGVEKICTQSPNTLPFLRQLKGRCCFPVYAPLIDKWQTEITTYACEAVQETLMEAFSQHVRIDDLVALKLEPYTAMIQCVYGEELILGDISHVKASSLWRTIPWEFPLTYDVYDAQRTVGILKILCEWAGISIDDYFKRPLIIAQAVSVLPFHYAMEKGMSTFIQNIIQNGVINEATFDRVDEKHNNTLHYAVRGGQIGCIRVFLEYIKSQKGLQGCLSFINACNDDHDSPMDLSVRVLYQQRLFDVDPLISEIYNYLFSIFNENKSHSEKAQRLYIERNTQLQCFYQSFQKCMNKLFLAHQVMDTGLVLQNMQQNWVEQGIEIVGENVPFPGAKLAAQLLSRTIGLYRQNRQNQTTSTLANIHVSPIETSEAVEVLARALTNIYEEPLSYLFKESVEAFANVLVKRIMVYWADYEPVDGLDEMTNISLYLSLEERDFQRIFHTITEQLMPEIIRKYFLKETLLRINGKSNSITDYQFLRGIGIREKNESKAQGLMYVKMGDTIPREPQIFYGYRLGKQEEAQQLGFYRQFIDKAGQLSYQPFDSGIIDVPQSRQTTGQIASDMVSAGISVLSQEVSSTVQSSIKEVIKSELTTEQDDVGLKVQEIINSPQSLIINKKKSHRGCCFM